MKWECFSSLVLCEDHSEEADTYVSVSLSEEGLEFFRQDIGHRVEECFGDSDFESWKRLGPEATEKLLTLIGGTKDPKAALLANFSGLGGTVRLRELCEENDITIESFCY